MDAEPKVHERRYYRHRMTGDRGYVVVKDGEMVMQYDRGPQAPWTEWKKNDWVEDDQSWPMSRMQAAEMAYGLVCRYWYYTQNHAKSRRKWDTLREEERINFMEYGPADEQAKKWYDAVMDVAKEKFPP